MQIRAIHIIRYFVLFYNLSSLEIYIFKMKCKILLNAILSFN